MADDERKPDWLRPHGDNWTPGPVEQVHDNPWFTVEVHKARAPTGIDADYFVQRYKNVAVGVLPLHDDGRVTLVGQWRFPIGDYSWELPEGGAPHDENPLEGAKRELAEEAGLKAEDWRKILTMQLSNASSDEISIGYLAMGLTLVETDFDPTEALTAATVPFREALDAAISGRIQDSITVAMLLRLHHMAYEGHLPERLAHTILGRNAVG